MSVEYTLSMSKPHSHLLEVEMRIPAAESPLELVLPCWTPGSYLIREYARNVQDFEVHDGSGLRLYGRKTAKNIWRIDQSAVGPVTVRYRVYANELSVRTSHLDASHAYVNGASVFMYPRGLEGEPARLKVEAPDGWRIATSLHETERGDFLAENYDELVDCPLEIGPHRSIAWQQEGAPHRYAIWGGEEVDETRLITDTRRIIEVCSRMFDGLPYDRYLFLVHVVPDGRGGLEHRTSCSLQAAPSWLGGADYESLLALVSHEYFHVWLGKRIRPEPLGPFDYTAENYTRNLWVVEGFTEYYTDLNLVRAGLMTPQRYLERLGNSIARLQSLPGRRHQTLEESSFDAWIKFYRPDAHTPNSQISYYHKGALVAMAVDLETRRATGGRRSLDDVMRVLWERYGRHDVGFPEDRGVRDIVEQVCGPEVEDLLARYVTGTDEIDFDRHLDAAGLALVADSAPVTPLASAPPERGPRPAPPLRPPPPSEAEWRLGARFRDEGGRITIMHVLEDGPAYDAGLNAGDELIAVDGVRATAAALAAAVQGRAAGTPLSMAVMRRNELRTVGVAMFEQTERRGKIQSVANPSPEQDVVRAGWLAPVIPS